jgi:hypothetical protein
MRIGESTTIPVPNGSIQKALLFSTCGDDVQILLVWDINAIFYKELLAPKSNIVSLQAENGKLIISALRDWANYSFFVF